MWHHCLTNFSKTTSPHQVIFEGKVSTIIIFKLFKFNVNLQGCVLCYKKYLDPRGMAIFISEGHVHWTILHSLGSLWMGTKAKSMGNRGHSIHGLCVNNYRPGSLHTWEIEILGQSIPINYALKATSVLCLFSHICHSHPVTQLPVMMCDIHCYY